jgi:hypothetical protein
MQINKVKYMMKNGYHSEKLIVQYTISARKIKLIHKMHPLYICQGGLLESMLSTTSISDDVVVPYQRQMALLFFERCHSALSLSNKTVVEKKSHGSDKRKWQRWTFVHVLLEKKLLYIYASMILDLMTGWCRRRPGRSVESSEENYILIRLIFQTASSISYVDHEKETN